MSSFSALMQRQIFVFTILALSTLASHIEDNDGDTLHHTDYHVASVMPKATRGRVPKVRMSGQDSSLNGTESPPPSVETLENTVEDTLMCKTVNNALSKAGCKIRKRKYKEKCNKKKEKAQEEAAPAQEDAQAECQEDAPAAEGDDAGGEAEEAGVLGPDEAADDAASSDDAATEEAGADAAAEDAEDAADPGGGAATADDCACEECAEEAQDEDPTAQDEDPTPCPTPSPTPGPTPCPTPCPTPSQTPCPTPDLVKMAVLKVTEAVQMVSASAGITTLRPTIAPITNTSAVQTTTSGPILPVPIFQVVTQQSTTLAAVQTTSSAAIQTTAPVANSTTSFQPYIVLHVGQGWEATTAAQKPSLVLPVNHTG